MVSHDKYLKRWCEMVQSAIQALKNMQYLLLLLLVILQ